MIEVARVRRLICVQHARLPAVPRGAHEDRVVEGKSSDALLVPEQRAADHLTQPRSGTDNQIRVLVIK